MCLFELGMGLDFIEESEALQLGNFFVRVMFLPAYALPVGWFFREIRLRHWKVRLTLTFQPPLSRRGSCCRSWKC